MSTSEKLWFGNFIGFDSSDSKNTRAASPNNDDHHLALLLLALTPSPRQPAPFIFLHIRQWENYRSCFLSFFALPHNSTLTREFSYSSSTPHKFTAPTFSPCPATREPTTPLHITGASPRSMLHTSGAIVLTHVAIVHRLNYMNLVMSKLYTQSLWSGDVASSLCSTILSHG